MDQLEKRISNLEIKFSYQDELLNQLNIIVADQQEMIREMTKVISEQSCENNNKSNSSENEKPPHY